VQTKCYSLLNHNGYVTTNDMN